MNIIDLPNEMIVEILNYCPGTIINVLSTCKHLHQFKELVQDIILPIPHPDKNCISISQPRISVWFAKEKALVLCKFPKGYEMIVWNTITDTFERGQWLTKKKLKFDRCGYPADGKYFGFFGMEFNPDNTFTVVCRPPFFTALYYQSEEGTWTGGVTFGNVIKGSRQVMIKPMMDVRNRLPKDLTLVPSQGRGYGQLGADERDITPTKISAVDQRGRPITAHGGCLYAYGEKLIDFTRDEFRAVKPPDNYYDVGNIVQCAHVYSRGINSGKQCTVKPKNGNFCSKHRPK